MQTEFDDFLKSKKISPSLFQTNEKEQYEEWLTLFSKVHPKSFVMQKLHLINQIRRIYHLDNEMANIQNDKP